MESGGSGEGETTPCTSLCQDGRRERLGHVHVNAEVADLVGHDLLNHAIWRQRGDGIGALVERGAVLAGLDLRLCGWKGNGGKMKRRRTARREKQQRCRPGGAVP